MKDGQRGWPVGDKKSVFKALTLLLESNAFENDKILLTVV